jgi:lysophospholipase
LNQTLNPGDVRYLAERRKLLPAAWRDWIGDGSNLGYDLDKLGITANNGSGLPVIGIAASGGGYRYVPVRHVMSRTC